MQFRNRMRDDRSAPGAVGYKDETPIFLKYTTDGAGSMRAGQFAAPEPRVRCLRSIKCPAPPQDLFKGDGETAGSPLRAATGWWRAVTTAMFGLSARFAGEFNARNEVMLSGILPAIISWTLRQILTGCAAYAQAIYPNPGCSEMDGPLDPEDSGSGSRPERDGNHLNRHLKASDISPGARGESRMSGTLLQWRQARPGAHDGARHDIESSPGHGDRCG